MKKAIIIILAIIVLSVIASSLNGENMTRGNDTEEVSNKLLATDISKFDYLIVEGKLILEKYKGRDKFIIINESYLIDGVNYEVKEIAHAIFNGCSANVIYLPKTLDKVYDDTLAYLSPDHIELYFGGSEEDWNHIFTKYEKSSAKEKWDEGDAAGAGEALADKLNAKFGHEYDASKFTYHFETSIDSIQLN